MSINVALVVVTVVFVASVAVGVGVPAVLLRRWRRRAAPVIVWTDATSTEVRVDY